MRARLAIAALATLALSGCMYHVGYRPVVANEIAVPIFENRTLRRGYEYALTERVRRRILDQTPLQLAHEARPGVSVLRGAVVFVADGVVIPPPFGDPAQVPIESSIVITVEVSLRNKSGRIIVGADGSGDGGPDAPLLLTESESFVPAFGQTRDSAADRALRKLAERIVDMLESGWGGAQER